LAAQQMEVLRRRRAVRDADVLLRRELEEPLEARARVLGPVALVAVRQQQRQARRLAPLRKPGRDELVDDDLRAVDEVAELRLPQDERLRRRGRVAVLEADARVLRERRVVDLERRSCLVEMLHRRERGTRVQVVQDRVAVRERATLAVLTGDSDRNAVDEERGKRERLGLSPVDAALLERAAAALELLHQLRMRGEPVGNAQELLVQLTQLVGGHRRDNGVGGGRRDAAVRRRRRRRAERLLEGLVRGLQLDEHLFLELVG